MPLWVCYVTFFLSFKLIVIPTSAYRSASQLTRYISMAYHNCVSVILGPPYSLVETIKNILRSPGSPTIRTVIVPVPNWLWSQMKFLSACQWISKEACKVVHVNSKLYPEKETRYGSTAGNYQSTEMLQLYVCLSVWLQNQSCDGKSANSARPALYHMEISLWQLNLNITGKSILRGALCLLSSTKQLYQEQGFGPKVFPRHKTSVTILVCN